MKFTKSSPSTSHMLSPRWVSENGVWEIGVFPVMFGKRVRAGLVNAPDCVVDYCAGADEDFLKELIVAIMIILESFDEDVSTIEVERILPTYRTKPINLDPCWPSLKRIALERSISKPNET